MVLVVTLGYRPNLGHRVRIDAAGLDGGAYHVFVRRIRAGSGCSVLETATYPADLVRVPRAEGAVTFLERRVAVNCN
jgi:hypothetical protein